MASAGPAPITFNHSVGNLSENMNLNVNNNTSPNEQPRAIQREAWIQKGTFGQLGGKKVNKKNPICNERGKQIKGRTGAKKAPERDPVKVKEK